jgi:hypothetical protein
MGTSQTAMMPPTSLYARPLLKSTLVEWLWLRFVSSRQKRLTTKGTKYHEGFGGQRFPLWTFVALVVHGFVNRGTKLMIDKNS